MNTYEIDDSVFENSTISKTFKEASFPMKGFNFKISIYCPRLYFVLRARKIPAYNLDKEKEEIINGHKLITTYAKAFGEGLDYFDKTYSISLDTLYSDTGKGIIKDLQENYFNQWWVAKNSGRLIDETRIYNFGLYSGIIFRIEDLIKKYPALFSKFYNLKLFREQQLNFKQSESTLTLREIALICHFKNEKITEGNQDTIAKKYGHDNKAQKLYSAHYKRIKDDEKEIYKPKYSKKYLNNIKEFFVADDTALKTINSFISKVESTK